MENINSEATILVLVRVQYLGRNMKLKTLVMTVGLPHSGKSLWAKTQNCPIVNPDSIRLALHGQAFQVEAEPFVWAIAKCMVRALFIAGHDRVILDATNISRKRRDAWVSCHWQREAVCFTATASECRKRVIDDYESSTNFNCPPDHALLVAIHRMASEYEPIQECEGFVNWLQSGFTLTRG